MKRNIELYPQQNGHLHQALAPTLQSSNQREDAHTDFQIHKSLEELTDEKYGAPSGSQNTIERKINNTLSDTNIVKIPKRDFIATTNTHSMQSQIFLVMDVKATPTDPTSSIAFSLSAFIYIQAF